MVWWWGVGMEGVAVCVGGGGGGGGGEAGQYTKKQKSHFVSFSLFIYL